MWLYEPKENSTYKLPIHSEDNIMPSMTWQTLIDTYVANYGHDVTPAKFRNHVREQLLMMQRDMWETLELCQDAILKEVRSQ